MLSPLKAWLHRITEMDVAEVASLPAIRRHLTHLIRFLWRVAQRFVADRCIQRASALGYASLLATVPLVALGFSVFTSFQAFDVVAGHVRDILLNYLLPTSQKVVQSYLGQIAGKAAALSVFGIIGLLFTATALLNTMEEAFNDIWRISRKRPMLSKFITFWSILTLSPVLIGASITITSYFTALPILRNVAAGASLIGDVPFLLPWMISSLAMTTLYMVLPNTSVPFRYAAGGGLVAGALFELSKLGFAFYVTDLANYERIYGALGTLPVFLIWLYLTWVVVLIGAEITFCLQHPEQSQRRGQWLTRPGIQQFFSHLILLRAAEALRRGESLTLAALVRETALPDNILQEWVDTLCHHHLLAPVDNDTGEEAWLPAREPSSLMLLTVHEALTGDHMEIPDAWQDTSLGRTLMALYFRLQREENDILARVSIHDLMSKEYEEEKNA